MPGAADSRPVPAAGPDEEAVVVHPDSPAAVDTADDPDRPPADLVLAGEEFPAAEAAAPEGLALASSSRAVPTVPTPPLDALVSRIPADVRERLDSLFRARFVQVIRVAPEVLSPRASAERPG